MKCALILLFFYTVAYADLSLPFSYGKAVSAAQKGNWAEAEEGMQRLLVDNPGNPQLLYDLGVACHQTQKFDTAAVYFDSVARAADTPAALKEQALFNLANTQVAQKKLHDALDQYQKVLDINPHNEQAKHNHGVVKKMLEEQKKQDQQKKNSQNNSDQKENSDTDNSDEKDDQDKDQQEKSAQNQSGKNNKKEDRNQKNQDSDQDQSDQGQSSDDQKKDGNKNSQKQQVDRKQDGKEQKKESGSGKKSDEKSQEKKQQGAGDRQETGNRQNQDKKGDGGKQGQRQGQGTAFGTASQQTEKADTAQSEQERVLAELLEWQENRDAQVQKAMTQRAINKDGARSHGKNRW